MTDVFSSRSSFGRIPGQDSSYLMYQAAPQPVMDTSGIESDVSYIDNMHDPSQKSLDKSEGKQQATFLTKLYALLERPEYQHMIRWDPKGEQIIVERPEQLALHVLPSIYRQSRFASFSRQLNIYGFMRKVNLRNVDPAIDDPDASTWSHPTLNRHSPPEVVANFKRRVPPRVPKARKRADETSVVLSSKPAPNPSVLKQPLQQRPALGGRPRGFSGSAIPVNQSQSQSRSVSQQYNHTASPYSLQPVSTPILPQPYSQQQNNKWNHTYGRGALPPLTIPSSDFSLPQPSSYSAFPSLGGYSSTQNQSSRHQPLTPTDDSQYAPSVYQSSSQSVRNDSNGIFGGFSYSGSDPSSTATSPIGIGSGYNSNSNFVTSSWGSYDGSTVLPPLNPNPASGAASLSALLNPSNISAYNRSTPSQQQHGPTSSSSSGSTGSGYPSPFSAVPPNGGFTRMGMPSSPDGSASRPTTGYSVSSMASTSYHNNGGYSPDVESSDYQLRPASSNGPGIIRRSRRSDAQGHGVSPYPTAAQRSERPMTAPDRSYDGYSGGQRSSRGTSLSMLTTSGLNAPSGPGSNGSSPTASEARSPVALSPSATFAYNVPSNSAHVSSHAQSNSEFAYTVSAPGSGGSGSSGSAEMDSYSRPGTAPGSTPLGSRPSHSQGGEMDDGLGSMGMGGVVARMIGVPDAVGTEGLTRFLNSRPTSSGSSR